MSEPITRQDLKEALAPIHGHLDKLEAGQAQLQAGQTALEAGQAELQAGQTRLDGRMDGLDGKMDRVIAILLTKQTAPPAPSSAADSEVAVRLDNLVARVETVEQEQTLGHQRLRQRIRRLERHAGLSRKPSRGARKTQSNRSPDAPVE